MRTIGIEAANSFVKIKSDRGETAYLNTVRLRKDSEEAFLGASKGGPVRLKYNGKSYTVGDYRDYLSSSGRDGDRYASEQYKLENVLGIAQFIDNGDEVRVVTGLPSKHYSEESRSVVEGQLLGEHTVHVDGAPRTFTVKEVHVILQPLGTLTHLLIKDDGTVRQEGLALTKTGKRSVVVDIGWGTTDVAVLEGSNLLEYFGLDTAMLEAYEGILERLELRNEITPFEAEQQLRGGSVIEYGGESYDAEQIRTDVLKSTARSIISKLKNRISLEPFDAVVFTGGGVAALIENIKEAAIDIPNAVPVREPQMANARGYYAYGIYNN
jgi:hypothetical protein